MTPEVSVCIATWRPEGIARVEAMKLPPFPEVEYVVSWQAHGHAPVPQGLLSRENVRVFRFEGTGVSANRNNALAHARGHLAFMADDDLIYKPEGMKKAIHILKTRPEIDIGVFAYEGEDHPCFPREETNLIKMPRGMTVGTIMLAERRKDNGDWPVWFDERFGPGSICGLDAAEDEYFLLCGRRKGLVCIFFPVIICHHAGTTTGFSKTFAPGQLKAMGAFIAKGWPVTAFARVLLKARRLTRNSDMDLRQVLPSLLKGLAKGYMMPLTRK